MATPVYIPGQLGSLLRTARLQQGYTQADVAKRMGISVQAMSKLENNAARAGFDRIHRLCLILGLDLVLQQRTGPDPHAPTSEW